MGADPTIFPMDYDRNCGLCRDIKGPTVLDKTLSFHTLPGWGQFGPEGGYLLIVTKDHRYTSTAGFPPEMLEELEQIMAKITSYIAEEYGAPPLFFEHGSACHRTAGQCVTHMHMNVVPEQVDLRRYLEFTKPIEIESLVDLHNVPAPYLYLRTPEGRQFVAPCGDKQIASQYLRQAIGIELGRPQREFWDWRCLRAFDEGVPDEDAVARTEERLRHRFSGVGAALKEWGTMLQCGARP